jgi:hypothetical protein
MKVEQSSQYLSISTMVWNDKNEDSTRRYAFGGVSYGSQKQKFE